MLLVIFILQSLCSTACPCQWMWTSQAQAFLQQISFFPQGIWPVGLISAFNLHPIVYMSFLMKNMKAESWLLCSNIVGCTLQSWKHINSHNNPMEVQFCTWHPFTLVPSHLCACTFLMELLTFASKIFCYLLSIFSRSTELYPQKSHYLTWKGKLVMHILVESKCCL